MANPNPRNKIPPKNGKGKKGRSGRRPRAIVEFARELASRNNVLQMVADMATCAEVRTSDRLRAAELLLNYAYGKPSQTMELSGQEPGSIPTKIEVVLVDP